MRTIVATTIICALSFAPAPARADDDYGLLHELRQRHDRLYGQLGFSGSAREIDRATVDYAGIVFGLAVQRGKLTLIGEAQLGHTRDHATVEDPMLSSFASDVGVYVRRDALAWLFGDPDFVGRVATWVTAGAGIEMMWFDSTAVYRPKAALGIGGGVEVLGRTKSLGFSFDVRLEVAPIVRWADGVAGRCAGSCEMSFAKRDYNLIGVFTLPFGVF